MHVVGTLMACHGLVPEIATKVLARNNVRVADLDLQAGDGAQRDNGPVLRPLLASTAQF